MNESFTISDWAMSPAWMRHVFYYVNDSSSTCESYHTWKSSSNTTIPFPVYLYVDVRVRVSVRYRAICIRDTTTDSRLLGTTIPCVTVWCSMIQCVAVCCSVMQCDTKAGSRNPPPPLSPTSRLRFVTPDKESSMSTLWQAEEFKQICSRESLTE